MSFQLRAAAFAAVALVASHLTFAATPAATATPAPAPAATSASAPADAADYTIEPTPAWVVLADESHVTPQAANAGMHYRVIDDQVRVEGRSESRYSHVVRVVDNAGGLATASQIELEFDPGYETLALHHLEVVRDGQRQDRLRTRHYPVLHRETQLERRMVDGRATVSIVLDDVRVGDRIEFDYTIRGANPVFDGRFSHVAWMTTPRGPVDLHQLRLLAPADRVIVATPGSPDITVTSTVSNGQRDTRFRRLDVPRLDPEAGTPYASLMAQQVQFSEFADWAAVARWGEQLFAQGPGGDAVARKAAEIRRAAATPEDRLLAALRFVQTDIRYFGNEVGVGSHRPSAPDVVMSRRFGDCKDKVNLLVALLRRLDIEAQPVLVSTFLNRQVDRATPSPLAFDHVIARVVLDGHTWWLDATRAHQSGPLAARQADTLGEGLVLAPGTTGLSELPPPWDTDRVVVQDTFRIERFTADPVLVARITYRGLMAESYREALATRSEREIAESMASPYVKMYPGIRARGPMTVEVPADDDAVTFVRSYDVPDFWHFTDQRMLAAGIVPWAALDALVFPQSERRRAPYGVGLPGVYRHVVSVEFPDDVWAEPVSQHAEDGDEHVALRLSAERSARRSTWVSEVRLQTGEVSAEDWSAFLAKVPGWRRRLDLTAVASPLPPARVAEVDREMRALEFNLRTKRVKLKSDEQVQAMYLRIRLNARIDANRVPPKLLAQLYAARGRTNDQLGSTDDASRDFHQALALAPESDDIAVGAGLHSFLQLDLDRTRALAGEVLKRHPHDARALELRALAGYFQGQSGPAVDDLTEVLRQGNGDQRGQLLAWLALALRQGGEDASALLQRQPASRWPTEWPRPVLDLLVGRSTPDAVLKAARAQPEPARALAEASFFLGEYLRATGDATQAGQYWRQAVDVGDPGWLTVGAAALRLEKPRQP